MQLWLLEGSTLTALEKAAAAGIVPTGDQMAAHVAALSGDAPRILAVVGNRAEIAVRGVLTARPDWLAAMFGGGNTTYREIVAAIAAAENDPKITDIDFYIDSPGGTVDGLFDTVAAMQGMKKPTRAVVGSLAASAAYALASQADRIEATNRAARIGSIGIAVTMRTSDNEVTITSTEAPKKRPDVRTEEGVAMVREELDAMHELFVEAIAEGRSTSTATVNSDYGRGATLLAGEAVKRGMIDAVQGPALSVVKPQKATASGGKQPEAGSMDLATLKAQHPDVYAAVMQEGVNAERDRVSAHVTMGEASGDMKTALTAIQDGIGMTAALQAKYMAAGMARRDVNNRQDDEQAAAAAAGAAATETADKGDEAGDAVAAAVEARLGLEA